MCKLAWSTSFAILMLVCAPLGAQTWNAGLSLTHSMGLGFEDWYGGGIVEASFNTNAVMVRAAIEVLDSQKESQESGWGGRLDLSLIRPLTEHLGAMAFYRPSFISQHDYSKDSHEVGIGLVYATDKNGSWTFFYGKSADDYHSQSYGVELRAGKGHWWRSRYEVVDLERPITGEKLRGGKIVVSIAPRLRW